MSGPENNDEVERLRLILRHAHDPRKSFTRKVIRRLTARMGAKIQKKAILERVEKPPKSHVA